jgi:hypothetical protein
LHAFRRASAQRVEDPMPPFRRHHDDVCSNLFGHRHDLVDGLAFAMHAREAPLGSVVSMHAGELLPASDVQQRDRRLLVAHDCGGAPRKLDCGVRVRHSVDGNQHMLECEVAVRQRHELALRIGRHEQSHGSRPSGHRFGHRALQPPRDAFPAFGRDDEKIGRLGFEVFGNGQCRKAALQRDLVHADAELREDVLLGAAGLEQAPTLERLAHGRKAAPAAGGVRRHVQDR